MEEEEWLAEILNEGPADKIETCEETHNNTPLAALLHTGEILTLLIFSSGRNSHICPYPS